MRAHVDYLTQIDVNVMAVSDSKGYNLKRMLELAQRKIRQTTRKVIEIAVNNDIGLRDPAVNMAKERITKASKK